MARLVKGVAARLLAPAALSLITSNWPEGPEGGRALGWYATAGACGFVGRLVLGGVLTEVSWWLVFALPVPIAVAALIAGSRLLPPDPPPTGRIRPGHRRHRRRRARGAGRHHAHPRRPSAHHPPRHRRFARGPRRPLVADITEEATAHRAVRAAVDAFGGLDILGNNAGRTLNKPITQTPTEDWDTVLAVNARGASRPSPTPSRSAGWPGPRRSPKCSASSSRRAPASSRAPWSWRTAASPRSERRTRTVGADAAAAASAPTRHCGDRPAGPNFSM
ncbi:hypothetical protein SANTM175S_06611 [Streptomyces antimycoticus]